MSSTRKRQPALSPEAHESRMIELAMKRAEQQLEDGTASAQVIVHFLKLGTSREQIEQEKIDLEKKLLEAKVDVLQRDNYYYWMWARALVDYAYRYRRPESPEPPTLEDTKQRQERQS